MDAHFYQTVVQNLTDNLHGITFESEYVNSLLSIMEANLSYIPSSTSNRELTDISLYDHVKITAAVASCVEQWLSEQGEFRILFIPLVKKGRLKGYVQEAFI